MHTAEKGMKNINFKWIDTGLGTRQANIQACQEGVMKAFKLDVITYLCLYRVFAVYPLFLRENPRHAELQACCPCTGSFTREFQVLLRL